MSYLNPILLAFDELDPVPVKKKVKSAESSTIGEPSANQKASTNLEPFINLEFAAAVLIAITDEFSNPEIIFTRRADHLNSHSGQVSFPGGRWEPDDIDLASTALRESFEEISLEPELVKIKGCMNSRISANSLTVQPYIGLVPHSLGLVPNPDEIADIFRVPLSFFRDVKPARIDCFTRHATAHRVPAWGFEGFDIWGLTAMFTYDLLKRLNIQVELSDVQSKTYD